ncbi:hypothetical protein HAX54_041025, partial [Datura stramonium]|nr:hypothetical protein [Datura stramonium]
MTRLDEWKNANSKKVNYLRTSITQSKALVYSGSMQISHRAQNATTGSTGSN